ncbi:MAG: hypothetical protein HOO89_11030 [Ferruginibacter sp.]|nr:hypothetical protein [Ferruginibacter sp.]
MVFKKAIQKILFFIPLFLLFIFYGLLHYPSIQTKLVKKVAGILSNKLHTNVKVESVSIKFFNNINIQGVLVQDLQKDTLLYVGTLTGTLNDWFFLKDTIAIANCELENTVVKLHRKDSVWNYKFLIDFFDSPSTNKGGGNPINLNLKELHFKNIKFSQIDEWKGQDMIASFGKLDVVTNLINLKNKNIKLKDIVIDKPFFAINDYDGLRPKTNTASIIKTQLPIANSLKWNANNWGITLEKLTINDGAFKNDKQTDYSPYTDRFDGMHLHFKNITGTIKNIALLQDSIIANVNLSATEKSGLQIKKLESTMKVTPDIMEFASLVLATNKSRLGNYYAMKYSNFVDDFSDFISAIKLEGHFKNSVLSSDDLAIFAPALKNWKRTFLLEGNAKGTIDNITAKDIKISTGNTFVDGNISMRGLPDIDATFINFQSKSLRTNYNELASIMPQIKSITNPAINKLGALSFVGNYTGFITDFVAYGNFTSAFGNIVADLNMKTPKGKPAKYSGNVATNNFKLGSFLNIPQLGNVGLNVKIDGTGFTVKDLKENVDGKIHFIQLENYTYKNLDVKGNFANKLFTGQASINDENLKISSLNGSINFLEKTPGFKLKANVQKADLQKLGFASNNLSLLGNFDLDFSGNNIDNFLGTAKITNAHLHEGNNKLSFDYLNLNSEIIAGKKSLHVQTNELDASILGNFEIMELPKAVTTMLAKYYPVYIKAPKGVIKSKQNFSFSIKTNNVDDYVKLIDKKLGGFNNANINGNFNLQNYNLNFLATIPEFSYDYKIAYNSTINAIGTKDTLVANVEVEDIVINDSMHLPNSQLQIIANNDISLIKLNTSASKIFGNAELNASIQTLSDGVKIHFYPSSFIINKNKWQLDKDGELTLRQNFIDASEIKFYNKEQAITLSSQLSEENGDTHLLANLKNVAIQDFAFLLPKNPTLKGNVTGQVIASKVLTKPQINFKGYVNNFELDGKYMGREDLETNVNTNSGEITYTLKTNEKEYVLDVSGKYNYKDTTNNSLQINANTERFNLDILKPYLTSVFSDISGTGSGFIQLLQNNNKMSIIGNPTISNAKFTVAYTQVQYKFNNQQIQFGNNFIDLGTLQVNDTLGNKGTVSGKIYHSFFDNFYFENLRFSTPKMLVLNTTKKDNPIFFGKVIGKAKMTLNGDIGNMKMNIDGEPSANPKDSSHVTLLTGDSKESNVIDYIDFVQFGSLMDKDISQKTGANLLINLDITANPACKIDVVLDETTGDVVRGQGNGLLHIKLGTDEPLSMRGRYDITDGEYTFDFQSLIKKPFTLNTGSIVWSGDPLLAIIDMKAQYLAKNVDISSITSNPNTRQQEDITVQAHLLGNLKTPIINFQFILPEKSIYARDFYVLKKLSDYKTDETEMYKQVASLLLLNQFISAQDGFINGSNLGSLATGTLGSFVSSWITSIFNKALENATNGIVGIDFDLNPSLNTKNTNQLQANIRSKIHFNLAKNLKIYVGGNIDYNNPIAQQNKLTPDLSVEWLINKDGTLRLVAFNRTSVDAVTTSQQNRTGLQLSQRKDVDKFGDIFRSKRQIKARKEKQLQKKKR